MSEKPKPPTHMKAHGKRFWERVTEHYDVQAVDLDALEQCCAALDRAETARRRIEKDGMVVRDRFGQPKAHPLCAVERDARSQFRQLSKHLGIGDEPENHQIGRPPRNWTSP